MVTRAFGHAALVCILAFGAGSCARRVIKVESRDVARTMLAVSLHDTRHVLEQLETLGPLLSFQDFLVLHVRNPSRTPLGKDSLRSLLETIHDRYPIPQLAVLTAGLENVRFLAPLLPAFVEWLGYDYAPGLEPEFARRRELAKDNFRLSRQAARENKRRFFAVCPLGVLLPEQEPGWDWDDLTRNLEMVFVDPGRIQAPKKYALVAETLAVLLAARSALFTQVTLARAGSKTPGMNVDAALKVTRDAVQAGVDGVYVFYPADNPALAWQYINSLRR